MASSTSTSGDYFSGRPSVRSRPGVAAATASPSSPRTPVLGRSISSQFGSPGSFRTEQEDYIIYKLGARHLSAGFAGESKPRCILGFGPESGRRVGDFRLYDPEYKRKRRKLRNEDEWGREYELFKSEIRALDLDLVEDKLERAVRAVHTDHMQLDQKPRKAILVIPSLLSTPLLEIALKVLFNHYSQPPSLMLLTSPIVACVGAGVRNALVVDIGWEETVVTAIGEYKEVFQRRSIKAGKMLTREMAKLLEEEMNNQGRTSDSNEDNETSEVSFEYAEEVTQRMAWCRPRPEHASKEQQASMVKLPLPDPDAQNGIHISFIRLSKPAESTLFTSSDTIGDDDHDLAIHTLAYRVLLALPLDLRALCISRIVFTGGVSQLPGLKPRFLQELSHLVDTRGWDHVHSYGSATAQHEKVLKERSANIALRQRKSSSEVALSPAKKPIQESVPHSERVHDDKYDHVTQKAEREARKGKAEVVKNVVRGVETLGAWAGASLMTSLRVKGVHEVERDDFLKHGYRDDGTII